jgi:hypothetical protein
MMTGLFENARSEILELIVEHGDSSRSMSSYFLHGAELGNTDYLDSLIGDAADNANQPRNFYCAACGLALVSDGLLGSTLIEAVANGQRIDVERDEPEFVLSLSSGRNE